jgi:hypothetical protein
MKSLPLRATALVSALCASSLATAAVRVVWQGDSQSLRGWPEIVQQCLGV